MLPFLNRIKQSYKHYKMLLPNSIGGYSQRLQGKLPGKISLSHRNFNNDVKEVAANNQN